MMWVITILAIISVILIITGLFVYILEHDRRFLWIFLIGLLLFSISLLIPIQPESIIFYGYGISDHCSDPTIMNYDSAVSIKFDTCGLSPHQKEKISNLTIRGTYYITRNWGWMITKMWNERGEIIYP